MSGKYGMGLLKAASLTPRQLVLFALVSAIVNGIVTAGVGAWLAQTYSQHQARKQSVENIANLFYARRTRAGMVVSSLRRNAPADEVTYRKRAYDEAYVDWNTNIRKNLFVIREVMGEATFSKLEQSFEDEVVASLAEVDRCLTKAYDDKLAGQSPLPALEACKMVELYQYALDCGATYTNELFKLSRLNFNPLANPEAGRREAEARIKKGCSQPAFREQPPAQRPTPHPAQETPATASAQPPDAPTTPPGAGR